MKPSDTQYFAIAAMSRGILALTAAMLAVPAIMAAAALAYPSARGLLWVAAFMVAIYLWIWLWWRPSRFEVTPSALILHFPTRRRRFPRERLGRARQLTGPAMRSELGATLRIGAGGVWGGFGWLKTQRRGVVEFYISRQDDYVLIEREGQAPLLLTPADSAGFARALNASA
ncbi:MAG: hypothetical protein Tsb0020_21760 [Haliangiales bacterium]